MQALTPKQIVEELDKHIIGQAAAKRAVAVAIRNRWRRRQLGADLAREVYPKNIIMMGPTGVGKTEIARRLAQLTGAPFIKVEASKYTEVGYHGRDVESMVRDLVEQAIGIVRMEQAAVVHKRAGELAEERLLDLLMPAVGVSGHESPEELQRRADARQRMREQIASGKLDEREVDVTQTHRPSATSMFANMGMSEMDPEMSNMLERLMPQQTRRKRVTIAAARGIFREEETEKLLDQDKITTQALTRAQEDGIIFLDEVDKIAAPGGEKGQGGPDVSRQGVQRDLLPIVEGSTVNTRYGVVRTDHMLFIAAGAFHTTAVSDLMPELQGRFPIRVELTPLTKEDFVRILTEPDNSLTRQQEELLKVEGLTVKFEPGAIEAMAEQAWQANRNMENIGARRLMTIVEKVFETINFEAPEMAGRGEQEVRITPRLVKERVAELVKDQKLGKYAL